MKSKYKFNEHTGYFGDPGSSSRVRVITSTDPIKTAQQFYDTAAYGGIKIKLPKGNGIRTEMRDGTYLTYRWTSKSGSPAVDIQITKPNPETGGIVRQKIHFELED